MNVVIISGTVVSAEQRAFGEAGSTTVEIENSRYSKKGPKVGVFKVELYGLHTINPGSKISVEAYLDDVRYTKDRQERSFLAIKGKDFMLGAVQPVSSGFDPGPIPF